ncbi:MAG: phosphoenolpyruvate--protein phosphotransferase [Acidobacteria bacterium RIFCSPLOWO2_02_FULL_67_36]|nr:MAG: phosphoenolpyruvate--protein phosphotransferase [Acidobacteria bacterium RIFCSPLOWO2_02_FULL_67_36]OFW18654.1 MAG: phosphoenolpyruvate--protein phosphotransferase [Acidobacteria bacterium RIFCSPLOWO2_12_FULL_66_21]
MRLTGVGVSPGVGVGKALVLKHGAQDLRFRIPAARVPREIDRLQEARTRSRRQIEQIKARIAQSAGADHAYLFDAQLLMLDDAMLVGRAAAIIRSQRLNASSALEKALEEISAVFDKAEDAYLRERKGDVADVVGRLRMNLRAAGDPADLFADLEGPLVLIADELSPSTVAQLDWQRLAGLVTNGGSWTHHAAILARSIHVPAVAALHDASSAIPPGALVAVDGSTGEVLVDPDAEMLQQFRGRQQRRAAYELALHEYSALAPVTADGVAILLEANLESPDDTERAKEQGAVGIGLFRTESLLAGVGMAGATEEMQYAAYRQLVVSMAPGRVTVRTFDVGEPQRRGDETPGGSALGLRGIRLSLGLEEVFQTQLRALLRAAAHGPLRIMFPFVSSVEELQAARRAVALAAATLRARGDAAPAVPVGVMIEVPSAALAADLLAPDADFFSIGTNDLIQYCLAVDRTDDRVSQLYQPLHPAIVRLVRMVVRAGRHRGIPVSVCGEMAADPLQLALLIGLGLREFSMAPTSVPLAKRVLRDLRTADAARTASAALRARTAAAVESGLLRLLAPLEVKRTS